MKKLFVFNRDSFSQFAAILAGVLAFLELCNLLFVVFVYKTTDLMTIVNSAISIMFDIFICSSFLKSKINFGQATWAITALLICNYIIPLIFNGISTIVAGGLFAAVALSPLIIGLIYFIMIRKFNRTGSRKAINTMIVCGALFLLVGIVELVIVGISYYEVFVELIPLLSDIDYIFSFAGAIFSLLTAIVSDLFCVVFFIYPFVLKKEY